MVVGGRPQRERIHSLGVEPDRIPDPGNAGTIEVARSGYVELVSTGAAETRTLPDPTFKGQILDLVFITDGGDCVVTTSSPINQTGNNTITFDDVGEHIRLVGFWNSTDGWEWRDLITIGGGPGLTSA